MNLASPGIDPTGCEYFYFELHQTQTDVKILAEVMENESLAITRSAKCSIELITRHILYNLFLDCIMHYMQLMDELCSIARHQTALHRL